MKMAWVYIGLHKFSCLVPETDSEYRQGLGVVDALKNDQGMVFVFGMRPVVMTMGAVRFPIDMLFVSKSQPQKVLSIHTLQPGFNGAMTQGGAGSVVELRGGICRELGIAIGARVRADWMTTGRSLL